MKLNIDILRVYHTITHRLSICKPKIIIIIIKKWPTSKKMSFFTLFRISIQLVLFVILKDNPF